MAARRIIAYCILVLGTATVLVSLLAGVGGWPNVAANAMGTAIAALTALSLSLALGGETGIPIHSWGIALSSLLLCAVAILPSLQQNFNLEVTVPVIVGGTFVLWVAWIILLGISHAKRITRMALVICVLVLMNTIASWLGANGQRFGLTGGVVLLAAGAVAGGLLVPYFRAGFEQVVGVE